ncbi:CRAL-TRIO domain-containing protein [Pilobolus umbonatus]|nr:CRAL-TRIO domain-containing protein [Pilobolus umbonatus]
MTTIVFPTEINLNNRERGHAGNLTEKEVDMLKSLWMRILPLFEQNGDDIHLPVYDDSSKKSGFFGFGAKKEDPDRDYFLGATSDPRWTELPLEKALPLIPGRYLHEAFWGMVVTANPDATLLRFLRARKWDLNAAFNMLVNTLRWRIYMRMTEIVSLGETGLINALEKAKPGLGVSFKQTLTRGMVTLGGPDRNYRGICFVNVQIHHKEDQPLEALKLLTVYIMEASRVICDYPTETVCIVFNLENFTMANMDFEAVKFLVNCFQAYYPETLGSACIHKAPWIFSTIWSIITPILDPVVASKINFTNSIEELEKFIPADSLPTIITNDPTRPCMDEREKGSVPKEGYSVIPDCPEINNYKQMLEVYKKETIAWANQDKAPDSEDAMNRLRLGLKYRVARIRADKVLRGETSFHTKGFIKITENNRLIIKYDTEIWRSKDITDWI